MCTLTMRVVGQTIRTIYTTLCGLDGQTFSEVDTVFSSMCSLQSITAMSVQGEMKTTLMQPVAAPLRASAE